MNKIIKGCLIVYLLTMATSFYAQDIISKKNGEEIQVKVEEVQTDKIKYKKHNNPNGPLYSIDLSEVAKIKYENGSEDIFVKPSSIQTSTTSNISTVQEQPTAQSAYARAYNSAISQPPKEKKDSKVKFGLETGLTISNVNSENYKSGASMEDWVVNPRFGFNIGMLVDFKLSNLISIQPELKLSLKGCKREGYTDIVSVSTGNLKYHDAFEEWNINFTYLEVPINLIFNISMGNGNLFLGGGPYLAYGIYGESSSSYSYEGTNINDEMIDSDLSSHLFSGEYKMYQPFDWGLNLLAGYEFSNGFFIKAGYALGLTSISTTDYDENDKPYKTNVKNNCFDLSIGIKF